MTDVAYCVMYLSNIHYPLPTSLGRLNFLAPLALALALALAVEQKEMRCTQSQGTLFGPQHSCSLLQEQVSSRRCPWDLDH